MRSFDTRREVKNSSTTEEFQKIQKSTAWCLYRSMSASAPTKELKPTPMKGFKETSAMRTGFGRTSNVWKTSRIPLNTGTQTWLKTSVTQTGCSNSTADGSSISSTTIPMGKVFSHKLLGRPLRPTIRIFQATTSCRKEKWKRLSILVRMTIFH